MSVPHTQFGPAPEAAEQVYPFTLADLPYAYDALEPHFDQKTLQVHHRGHHVAYVKKLNEAVAKHPGLQRAKLAELLRDVEQLPADVRTAVVNNGGGHLNHDLFWNSLAPRAQREPGGALADAIARDFGSFAQFRRQFSEHAEKHFASGWVALALDPAARKLEITELHEHAVLKPGARATLLILDIWEHAYYLKFQNRRPEFIEAFWNVVNWPEAAERFARSTRR